jgi:hypothetical protein
MCNTSCAGAADCADGAYCELPAGMCKSKLALGRACTMGSECGSGLCVDGVCCNAACGDQCQACNLPDSLGTCVPIVGKPVGTRTACAGSGVCGGACDGKNTKACVFPARGTSCAGKTCSNGVAHAESTCDGAGMCVPGAGTSCGRAGCNGDVCGDLDGGGPGTDEPNQAGQPGGCAIAPGRSINANTASSLLFLALFNLAGLLALRRRRARR